MSPGKSWREVSDTSRQFAILPNSSMCRRANQSADNGPDCGSSKRDPTGVPAVMDMVNDMMPRRRRRAMRTMPPVMRRGNRRTSRQNHTSHENRNCLDDLVHITPTFPDFLSLQIGRNHHRRNLTNSFIPPHLPSLSSLIDSTRPYLGRARCPHRVAIALKRILRFQTIAGHNPQPLFKDTPAGLSIYSRDVPFIAIAG